jgi:hypothetical protein
MEFMNVTHQMAASARHEVVGARDADSGVLDMVAVCLKSGRMPFQSSS